MSPSLRLGPVVSPPTVSTGEARLIAHEATQGLERRLQALELACAAMWMILQEHHGYTDEQLVAKIHEVDARDGIVDGKIGNANSVCPQCGRKLLTRQSPRCAWCGCELPANLFK